MGRAPAVLVLLLLGLAACTSAPGTSPAPAPASSAGTSSGPDPDAGLLTGAQLRMALAAPSFFPPGFTMEPGGTRDTGSGFNPQSTRSASKPDCRLLDGTSWTLITGINGVSFAQNDYVNPKASAEIAQEIDVYQGTGAQAVMESLGGIGAVCRSFPEPKENDHIKVTEEYLPGVGDGAYLIQLIDLDPDGQNDATLIAARTGTAVVTVLANNGTDNGRATALKLANLLVNAVRGKA